MWPNSADRMFIIWTTESETLSPRLSLFSSETDVHTVVVGLLDEFRQSSDALRSLEEDFAQRVAHVSGGVAGFTETLERDSVIQRI